MPCGKNTMKWKRAMNITRRNYPHLRLTRRQKIAGGIIGGKKRRKKR